MRELLIGIILLTIQQFGFCQINLDSLKLELDKSYITERSGNSWNAYTIKYLDQDSLVRFIIPFNQKGEIEESIWGIALSQFKYDKQKREIERRYYDKKGNLHFSDWPPIIKIYYDEKNRVIRKDYFGETEKPVSGFARIEFDYNKDGERSEERMYNGKYELDGDRSIVRFEYQDSNKVVIESRFNQNLELVKLNNIAYVRSEYLSSEREYLVETRYLNENKELTLIEDSFTKMQYAIEKYTYNKNGKGAKIEKFDQEMNLVHESWKYIPPKKN